MGKVYLRLAVVFLALFFLGTTGMFLFEKGENQNFKSFAESCWSSTVYILSGFEDRQPVTYGGKAMPLFIFVASLGILGSIAGKFASVFIRMEVKKMPKGTKDHIVICNWNDRGDKIINELHAPQADPDSIIAVITEKDVDENELRKQSKRYEKVFFVKGDPSLHNVLKANEVHLAKSVIILADEDSPDPDALSALIALALRSLCKSAGKPHVVAEVKNHRKMKHLEDAGVDETICATDYGLGVLAQCALHAKLSLVYNSLLQYTKETNEIYMAGKDKLPKNIIGKTFQEAAEMLNKNRDPDNPAILLGVRRGDKVILNPQENWKGPADEKFERFEEDDSIILMAFDPPDLSKIE